jgi:hypothetical protein
MKSVLKTSAKAVNLIKNTKPKQLKESKTMFKLPNPKNTIKTLATVAIVIGGVITNTLVAQAIELNVTYAPGTTPEQRTSVEMAKNIVSSYLKDNDDIINIHVGMNTTMSTDYLALATPAIGLTKNYGQFLKVLNLIDLKTKYKRIKQDGKIEETDKLMITTANARVLEFKLKIPKEYKKLDGYIQFNNNAPWHYNYTENTPMDKYDMTTIAIHEIFHVLGVISGIDPVKVKTPYPTTLDLFRYSEDSKSQGAIDFRQGQTSYLASDIFGNNSGKYLSKGTNMSLGGDGYQASHWSNNPGSPTGIMNPTQYTGQKMGISEADLSLLRLIGYDVNNATLDLAKLYNDAQTQAISATIVDQTKAVQEMIADSGVYETSGSGGGTSGGWWERAAEHDSHGDHNHQH